MTPPSPLLVLLMVLAVGGPSLSPALALPDALAHNQGLYSFAYAVDAPEYKNFHDREEARLGQETRGRFRVALPDNRLQTVTYRADGNGYTASISYDQHPSFEALRQSVGPILAAPEVGQSILDGIRRGENWKHHKGPKDESHPESGSFLLGHGAVINFLVPTLTNVGISPTPTLLSSALPHITPTRTRPAPTPKSASKVVTPPRSHPQPSLRHSTPTTRPKQPATTIRRTTSASSPLSATRPSHRDPAAGSTPSPTPIISPGDTKDSDILDRLIIAIQQKAADNPKESSGGPPHPKKPYSIADRESVRRRLEAVVHPAKY